MFYINIVNDRSVVYYMMGIMKIDLYVDMLKIKINFLLGYDGVIFDLKNLVFFVVFRDLELLM